MGGEIREKSRKKEGGKRERQHTFKSPATRIAGLAKDQRLVRGGIPFDDVEVQTGVGALDRGRDVEVLAVRLGAHDGNRGYDFHAIVRHKHSHVYIYISFRLHVDYPL